ncbi:high mobility group protein B4, putative [Plasmodium ovale wallikeri]|uniref:High mobility group protein B4, putative n=1 Tax=Plasmodium ovale wallikeri TaxID=864142 RepID=A0A1A8YZY3_PLAOA|nr:high mobility group protein B4, putative [Plasmodium ovale wallikeri]SBT37896.1 high mobility group protein B4, putative [Plasmodium ovale wallikeri]
MDSCRKKPKAPPSSYLIFCNSERENAKNAILEKLDIKVPIRITEVQKELSLKWKSLSSEDRKVEHNIKYDEEARLLKLKYSEDLLEWQKSLKACGFAKVKRNRKIKFSNSKIQKIMHLNSSFRKVLFLIEIVNKTLEYKIEKKSAQHISSLDIDCFYLMKGPRIRSCFLEEEEENDTSIFDLCEEDKKEYNYDIEEKKLSRMKRKMNSSRAREKMTENKTIYADISTFFKKV